MKQDLHRRVLARSIFQDASNPDLDRAHVLGNLECFILESDRKDALEIDKKISGFARPTYTTDRHYKLETRSDDGSVFTVGIRIEKLAEKCRYLPDAPIHKYYQSFSVLAHRVSMGPAYDLRFFGDELFGEKGYESMEDGEELYLCLADAILKNKPHFEEVVAKAKKTSDYLGEKMGLG